MFYSSIFYLFSHFLVHLLSNEGKEAILPDSIKSFSGIHQPIQDSLLQHIYLSFDDGPILGTSNCIAILTQQKVAATYFQVGLHQSRNKEGQKWYREIRKNDSLFVICNHSYSHAYGKYLPYYHHPKEAFADFIFAKELLQPNNNVLRLPGNNAWNILKVKKASGLVRPLVHLLDSAGFNIIGWDMEWRFNKSGKPIQSPESLVALVDSVLKFNQTVTKNHVVILMHDHMFRNSADSIKLAKMITLLKLNPHYQFERLTNYPGLKN